MLKGSSNEAFRTAGTAQPDIYEEWRLFFPRSFSSIDSLHEFFRRVPPAPISPREDGSHGHVE